MTNVVFVCNKPLLYEKYTVVLYSTLLQIDNNINDWL